MKSKIRTTLLVLGVTLIFQPSVLALTSSDIQSLIEQHPYYDPGIEGSFSCNTTHSSVSTTQPQADIIKVVIGIAKADNLGQAGATIGLMVADAESGFKIYANSTVPVSLSIPHQAVGSNYDSVGVFQQRPSTGWSTIATGSVADANQAAVAQLMDPAYAAEAFFGSPSDSGAPSALSKGLQNYDWQSMSPAQAATTVQGNQNGASTYQPFLSDAESFVNQYWASSPVIPLPVPLSGESIGSNNDMGLICSGSSALGTYKNPLRDVQQLRPRRIDQGVDYAGQGPVYALGDGIITNLTNSGWNFGGYDAFIGEQLSDGPAKGLYVYVAEACIPTSTLQAGDTVNANTIICNMINPADTGIETGWAAAPGNGAAIAKGQYDGGATSFGVNYNQLFVKLGAPSGINETNTVTGTLPSDWPQW